MIRVTSLSPKASRHGAMRPPWSIASDSACSMQLLWQGLLGGVGEILSADRLLLTI